MGTAAGADELRAALVAAQNDDGGFGARAGLPSATEATALALLALERAGGGRPPEAARAWLRAQRLAAGGWPVVVGQEEAGWPSALAVIALAGSPADRPLADAGAAWLLAQRGRRGSDGRGLLARLVGAPRVVDLDESLVGWPWRADTFSWVEPTAYALLALRLAGARGPLAAERIAAGDALLLDRRCDDGGWNYGNSRVLGEDLWSYPDTTAIALLALHWHEPRPDLAAGLARLEALLERTRSGLALGLGVLALDAYGREVGALRDAIGARFRRTGFVGETRATALALLALASGPPPFTEPARA